MLTKATRKLADAKLSTRQQCVYEAASEETYSKSTMCDFLLMVNSNCESFNDCEMFLRIEVKNCYLCLLYSDCRPPSGGMPTPSIVSVTYSLVKSTFSSSFV